MKRTFVTAAAILLLVGLELAAGTVSLTFSRLWIGLGAVVTGREFFTSPLLFVPGVVALTLGAVMAVLVVGARSARRGVTLVGPRCPRCGEETRRIKRKLRHRVLEQLLDETVTRRHCDACGWTGLAGT